MRAAKLLLDLIATKWPPKGAMRPRIELTDEPGFALVVIFQRGPAVEAMLLEESDLARDADDLMRDVEAIIDARSEETTG